MPTSTASRLTLPASQLNVAVCGGSGDGKSYLAGLICEQLVRLGYSLIVSDPEGDHVGLGELRGVLVTGGDERRLADPAEVVRLLRHRYATVVVDLSHLDAADEARYVAGLPGEIEAQRAVTGLPQWVVVDEAHRPFGRTGTALGVFNPAAKGYLLVTWQPEELSGEVTAALDAVIALGSPRPSDPLVDLTAAVAGMPRAEIARLLEGPTGRAVLAWRAHPRHAVAFTLGPSKHSAPPPRAQVQPRRRRARPPVLFHVPRPTPPPVRSSPTSRNWKTSSPAATRACCATTAPGTTSPAGSPASFTTSRSPPRSPPPKPESMRRAPPRSSNRYASR